MGGTLAVPVAVLDVLVVQRLVGEEDVVDKSTMERRLRGWRAGCWTEAIGEGANFVLALFLSDEAASGVGEGQSAQGMVALSYLEPEKGLLDRIRRSFRILPQRHKGDIVDHQTHDPLLVDRISPFDLHCPLRTRRTCPTVKSLPMVISRPLEKPT